MKSLVHAAFLGIVAVAQASAQPAWRPEKSVEIILRDAARDTRPNLDPGVRRDDDKTVIPVETGIQAQSQNSKSGTSSTESA